MVEHPPLSHLSQSHVVFAGAGAGAGTDAETGLCTGALLCGAGHACQNSIDVYDLHYTCVLFNISRMEHLPRLNFAQIDPLCLALCIMVE